ncbi:MAG: hypothetical protein C7B44_06200 [Sulfobacillus thermosulfidooxidans]|nr:MAG: hypothetical protein C7B44_06200 [Sulfobacillus thermosulfidooxidans]
MSHQLLSHSPDLYRLMEEGYDVEISDSNLIIKHVPYVTSQRTIAYGTLVSELSTNGTATIKPRTHEVWFIGELPCDNHGRELDQVINQRTATNLGTGLMATCSFSSKPPSGNYDDYYQKMTAYIRILSGFAKAIDPTVTARIYPAHPTVEEESVFRYLDTASSRSGISAISGKLKQDKVAIVGLGGTGSYILDLVSKTPIGEIHLYDDDTLYAHNAFRTPGAASLDELKGMPKKVEYLFSKYDPMHRHIIPHAIRITRSTVNELHGMDFVFMALDVGSAKRSIIEYLESQKIPFIDCGMGVYRKDDSLGGVVRVTAVVEGHGLHVDQRISFGDLDEDEYDWNIQTADLNMLNASLAVLKWKKLCGFYIDRKQELFSSYVIGRNQMVSEDRLE